MAIPPELSPSSTTNSNTATHTTALQLGLEILTTQHTTTFNRIQPSLDREHTTAARGHDKLHGMSPTDLLRHHFAARFDKLGHRHKSSSHPRNKVHSGERDVQPSHPHKSTAHTSGKRRASNANHWHTARAHQTSEERPVTSDVRARTRVHDARSASDALFRLGQNQIVARTTQPSESRKGRQRRRRSCPRQTRCQRRGFQHRRTTTPTHICLRHPVGAQARPSERRRSSATREYGAEIVVEAP